MDQWLENLRDALDHVEYGVVLLDQSLVVRFMNRSFREMWTVPEPPPGQTYTFEDLIYLGRANRHYKIPPGQQESDYVADRIARVKAGADGPRLLRLVDGRVIKFECILLPLGGRMLTYADETELVQAVEKLEAVVNVDELTQISNRRYLCQRGQEEIARSKRHERPVSAILLDIDHFKLINDAHGHASGDAVLAAVAGCCRETLRSTDLVGRLGGEEFALLLPETGLETAAEVAEKLRKRIAALEVDLGAVTLQVTASFGVATLTPAIADFDALLRQADFAMYKAKQSGRDRVCVAREDSA